MEAVLPLYEQATVNAFYNRCVVVAVEAVLSLLPEVTAAAFSLRLPPSPSISLHLPPI